MKIKTFILTFLMMSCSIVFGQGTETGTAKSESQLKQYLFNDDYGTIIIGSDIAVSSTIEIPQGRKITIDLNGHKLSTNSETYIFRNFGRLTIKDSGVGGAISTLGIYNGKPQTRTSTDDINYSAQLTIEGGVFNNIAENGGAAIYNYLGVINIKGGEFYGEYSAITNYGVATIKNAYIECLNRDNGAAAIINDFEIEFGENVEIVGRYTTVSSTGAIIESDYEPTYLFAELNGKKYPSLQAALDACAAGNNTINLLFHNSEDATVSQKEGVNITIDGNGYKEKQFEYSGTIYVNGNSRHTGAETLTIQDINFVTTDNKRDFISCDDGTNSEIRYAHNVTVENCNFTATEASESVVALRFRQSYNINVVGGTFTNLHSAMWATGTSGIIVNNITADCKEGGISLGTSTDVEVKNSTIEGAQYGVRADGSGNYSLNIEGGKLTAAAPVIVRNTTAEYNLTVNNNVELVATANGPQVVVTAAKDDAPYVVPTSDVNVTLYNNVTSTFGLTAKIGNNYYSTFQNAINAVKDSETVTLVAACAETVTFIQTKDKSFVLDGNNKTYTGRINITARAGKDAPSTLNIKKFNFTTTEANHNFIYSSETNYYPNNITIASCTFEGTGAASNVVPITLKSANNITIQDCKANNVHSLLQNTSGWNLTIKDCEVTNAGRGMSLGSCQGVLVENVKIQALDTKYGIRVDAAYAATTTINNCQISAFIPVVARNASADYALVFNGTNTIMTAKNTDGLWCAIGASEYEENGVMPTAPTAYVSVTLNDTGLNSNGIYGSALSGKGTEAEPYLIKTVNDLVFFRDQVNAGKLKYNTADVHIALAADIDMASVANWTPIGDVKYNNKYVPVDANKVFKGTFDGKGKVISNLKVEKIIGNGADPDEDANVGLFGITGEGVVIKNLTLTNVNINTSGRNVGALAGYAYKATLDNITVNGDIQIKGGNNVSGVAGMTRYYAMSATNIKVVGNDGSTIVGNNIVGGIFAEIAPNGSAQTFESLSVENVAITGASGVGGIVGLLTTGAVNNVSVKNVVLTGRTDYQGNAMGRIRLGSVAGLMGNAYATITNPTVENVTAKNLDGNAVVLPIIGANYSATSNATEAKIGDTYYATLQGAINAAKEGTTTINLLADIAGNVTISQVEGKNIVIDGKKAENENYKFYGTIYVDGNSRNTGEETLTIQNIAFYTEKSSHDFISCNETTEADRYAHNVTVTDCDFATSEANANNSIVGMRFRQVYGIAVKNCTSNNIFSLMWSTSVEGLALNKVTVNNCTEGITIGGASKNVAISNSEIISPSFGIRASVEGGQFAMSDSKIEALVPVVVRNENGITDLAKYTLSFTFEGTNTITESNPTNYWFVAGETEYKGSSEEMPAAPNGSIVVNLNDADLSYDGVYGNFAVAKIGSVQYLTFEAALNAVQNGETIEVLNVEGSEVSTVIEYTNDIEFTITGTAPDYVLPIITFQNAKVNIVEANIKTAELDARQNATINVKKSIVKSATGNPIVKSYYNGRIIIDESEVYTHQATTMGYIDIINGGELNVTWQTNVYGNGLITVTGQDSEFRTAAFNLTAKDYKDRDNTDADRVGKPATVIVDGGATLIAGNVDSASGADYSYETEKYGINIGTEGKAALLDIKTGATVEFYMKPQENSTYKKPVIGADGTVNVNASTFNVKNRDEAQTLELANNGTVNVTGEASINIKKLTGKAINFTDVTIADAYIGGRVNAFGTNNINGTTIIGGILSLGYETNPSEQVVVNITGNFNGTNVIISTNNNVDNILNVGSAEGERTTAHFAQLGAFADVNIVNSDVTYGYAFVRNDFKVTNSTMEIKGGVNTYFAGNAKVVLDNTTWNLPGFANIGSYGGYMYGNADVTLKNGSSMTATNLGIEVKEGKVVKVTIEDNSRLEATKLTNQGSIVLADVEAKVTSNEFDNVPTTSVAYHKVNYVDGSYVVVAKDYVAQIYDVNNNTNDDRRYETLAEAATAALNGETIELLWTEGNPPIAMNASLYGKNVTITGTAKVDWSKGWLFVGRGGEGNATLTFDGANLTSASADENSGLGIHVSGREKGTNNKYDGTLVIKNSTIELDYLIDRGTITLGEGANLTVKNGFGIAGRPASETENDSPATATISLENGAILIVNNHNGMGVGQASTEPEGYGIMNIDATSTFKTTQSFLITSNGTMNNAGTVAITGALTNNGKINFTSDAATLATTTGGLTINYNLDSDKKVVYNEGVYQVVDKVYVAQIEGGNKFESLQEAINAVAEGETIKLLSDITVTEAAYGQNALNHARAISFTLDLNGKTLSANTGNSVFRFNISGSGATEDVTVTIKNGTVVSGEDTWCTLMSSGISADVRAVMNLEDLVIENYKGGDFAVKAWANGVVNAKNVTINASYGGGFYALGGEITLDNCTVKQEGLWTAPYLSMTVGVSNGGKMTVNSGTYSAVPHAVADGNNQGTSHGSWCGGVMSSGGTLVINGGTFSNGNIGGTAATNPRELFIVGADADYGDNVNGQVIIKGGTFTSIGDFIHCETIWGSETDPANDYMPTMGVTITAGDFTAVAGKTIGGCDPVSTGNPVDVEISGGTYGANHAIDDSYLVVGYIVVDNPNGTYSVVEDQVAKIGDVTYKLLQEAFDAAQDGDEIVVLKEIVLTAGVTVAADKVVVLDLNGKTISMQDASNNSAYAIKNNGNLTIKDSAEGGKITFNSTTPDSSFGYATSTIGNGGHLTIENGSIENTTVGGASYAVDGIWHTGEASLTINDGTIKATEIAVRQVPFSATAKNTVTINGGTLTGETAGLQMFNISDDAKLSETIIKGGTFNGTYAFYTSFRSAQASGLATINIDGGTFNGYLYLYNGKNGSNAYPMTVAITDGLFNSEAYIYTKDANGNEVPIKAISGGIFSVDPTDYCAENYGAFPYDENSWVVRQISGEQTFELTAGWNWVSSYITEFNNNGLSMLQVGLGTKGIQIKNNLKSSTYSNQTGQWNGSLTTTSVDEMYKVKVGELEEGMESLQFKFEGSYVNYDERAIILYPGWNYIGYPVNVETNVADALVLLSADGQEEFNGPSVGDVLKSQQGAAIYFGIDNMPWMFDNQFNLIPGEGYMYHNTSGAVKILRYTTKNSSATTATNNRSSKYWTVDATQYSSNMTMIAMTDVEGDNYEVAAFVNGEVRGSSRPVYVESLDAYILILTISGDDVEEMTFRYYDITTGEEVEFSNRINYSSDAVVGSIAEPYMLTRGTTGIGEAEMSQVNIYPNPTTTGTEINLQATCDKVEVFNALGAKVAEYQNVDSIDALETAGIYVIRITNNGNVQNCKLVVK